MAKSGIHPELQDASIECACGNIIITQSTRGSHKTDVCSQCHPFYTGERRLVDTEGRVERFNRKYRRG